MISNGYRMNILQTTINTVYTVQHKWRKETPDFINGFGYSFYTNIISLEQKEK